MSEDLTIRRQALWASESAIDAEVSLKEAEMIKQHPVNAPSIDYSQFLRFKK
jgi:hypothetical protein